MSEKVRVSRSSRIAAIANLIVTGMLRVRLRPGPACLLNVRGRRSERMYSTPVSPLEYGGQRYLVAGDERADWVKNVRAAERVVLSCGRRSEKVKLVEVNQGERGPILKEFVERMHGGRLMFEAGPDSPLKAFEEEAPRHPVFEVTSASKGLREADGTGPREDRGKAS